MKLVLIGIAFAIGLYLFILKKPFGTPEVAHAETFVSVKTFGAKGDGHTDDAGAIEKTIVYCIKNNLICWIPKTTKSYQIGSTIRVSLEPGQIIRISSDGAVIKPLAPPINKSAYNLTHFREHVFLSIGKVVNSIQTTEFFNQSLNTSVKITGLVFDGSNLKTVFASSSPETDIFIGLQLLAENVSVDNCTFRNIYGYGMRVHNVKNSTITNCNFNDVGGRGATMFGQGVDLDGIGDGIYHAMVKKDGLITIKNCTFTGKKTQGKRSRSALTFEYSTQPYRINLTALDISGFAKCIHIEEKAATVVNIDNVSMSDFNAGIANVLNDQSVVYFNKVNISTGLPDGNENGDALAFLNYESKAKIYVRNSVLNFKGRPEAYQSAVGLVSVDSSTIDGNLTNFFFADGSTVFNKCTFVNFGGKGKSFASNRNGKYELMNCIFKNSPSIHAQGEKLLLKIQ